MILRIGSLNVRGLRNELKQRLVATDLEKYNINVLLIQETHIKNNEIFDISSFKKSQ